MILAQYKDLPRFPWTQHPRPCPPPSLLPNPSARCKVFSLSTPHPLNPQQPLTLSFQTAQLFLHLQEDHLLLYDALTASIIDFLPCSPQLSFQILNYSKSKRVVENDPCDSEGGSVCLELRHQCFKNEVCTFVVEEEWKEALELLGIHLGRQFITQLNFHHQFKPVRKLGKGLTAVVYAALRLADSSPVAIKAFKKSTYFSQSDGKGKLAFKQQLRLLTKCRHPNLCSFDGLFQTDNSIYIVMEHYPLSLASLVAAPSPIDRQLVVSIMEELLRGVGYLHERGVMHRDIKLENIMLKNTESGFQAVLIDLGMAQEFADSHYLFEKCGTPGYAAPEIFGQRSSEPEKCDIFSLGVVFHVLLFKKAVFAGSNAREVLLNNRNAWLSIDYPALEEEEPLVKDLLLKMLERNYKKRISAEEALKHPLFQHSILTPSYSDSITQAGTLTPLEFASEQDL